MNVFDHANRFQRKWQTVAHRGRESANDRLAAELAAGKTVRDAAASTGIAERTVFRRMAEPSFTTKVNELRALMVNTAAGQLADGLNEAVRVLRSLLAHTDPHVRHRAAVKLIELTLRVRSETELESRIAALERLQAKDGRT